MEQKWALILGASSGFGGASAVELSKNGYNIFGVHLDRQATMPAVQQIIKKIGWSSNTYFEGKKFSPATPQFTKAQYESSAK